MGFLTFTNSHLFVIQHIYREHFFHLCNFYLLFPNYIFIHFRHSTCPPTPIISVTKYSLNSFYPSPLIHVKQSWCLCRPDIMLKCSGST